MKQEIAPKTLTTRHLLYCIKFFDKIVEKVVAETNSNTKKTALNEQAIKQIADGLSRQVEISQATDEKLGTLIELMLKERR